MFFRLFPASLAFTMLLLLACEATGIGGKCHDSATGEVLREVEDVNGKAWPVKKHPDSLKYAGQTLNSCAVSIEAVTQDRQYTGQSRIGWRYLFHADTGSLIEVKPASKGLKTPDRYEWY